MPEPRAGDRRVCRCRTFATPHHPDACYSVRLEKDLIRLEKRYLGWTDRDLLRNTVGSDQMKGPYESQRATSDALAPDQPRPLRPGHLSDLEVRE